MYKLFLQAHISDTYRALKKKRICIETCDSRTSWPPRTTMWHQLGGALYAEERWTFFRHHQDQYKDYMAQTCSIDRVLREATDITTSFLTHHTSMLCDAKPPKISVRESVRGHTWYSDSLVSSVPREEKEAAKHKALHNAQATYEAMYAIFCVPFACGASKYQALDTSTTKAEAEQHSEVGEQRKKRHRPKRHSIWRQSNTAIHCCVF